MSNRRELRGNGKCKHSVKSNHIWSKLMYARFVSFLWETTLILFYEHASNLTDLFRCRSIGMLIIHCESENRTWTRQECVLCVNSQLSQMMSRGSTLSQRDFFRISRSCSLVAPLLYLYCFQSVFFCDMFMSSEEKSLLRWLRNAASHKFFLFESVRFSFSESVLFHEIDQKVSKARSNFLFRANDQGLLQTGSISSFTKQEGARWC